MTDIPVEASVKCIDGPCGKSLGVIVNPVTQEVTHFVVRDETLPEPYERLVPFDQVARTSADSVRLRCSKAQLSEMEPFFEKHYIAKGEPDWGMYHGGEWQEPYATTLQAQYSEADEARIPPGELAVHRGTRVEATDGDVGHVGELVIDPDSGHITHFVMDEGHLWGKQEITLPLSAIDHVRQDTVYLKLSKEDIERLPTIPLQRHHGKESNDARSVEMVARVFDNPHQASEALEFVEDLHRRKVIKILNAAVLVKSEDGTTSITDTKDLEPGKGRLIGAITGGLIGLLAGPVGAVVGALAGLGAGSLAARWTDLGFSDKFLAGLEEHLQPGTSALIVLAEHEWVEPMSESLADLGGIVLQQTLTDKLVEELVKENET